MTVMDSRVECVLSKLVLPLRAPYRALCPCTGDLACKRTIQEENGCQWLVIASDMFADIRQAP